MPDHFCKRCLMPRSRPRIVFEDGVCNACLWAAEKDTIDWEWRHREFKELLERYRGGAYDCVVPFSGGKDSAAVAWRLKHEYGVRPLLVCYGQLLWTECGRHNLDEVCRAGFDILYWRVDQAVSRKLARRFMVERGHPKQHYDAGVNAVPVRTAQMMNIPLVVYAEHGESEYGGLVLSEEHRRRRDITEVLEHQVGDHPANWATGGIEPGELHPYVYPGANGVEAVYFSYYHRWNTLENVQLVASKMNFMKAPGRSDGTFTDYDSIDDKIDDLDFYMMWVKFGFGRATRDANRLLQQNAITRDKAAELAHQYDGEFPERYLGDVLNYLDMTKLELLDAIERHRNPLIWQKEDDRWLQRNPLP